MQVLSKLNSLLQGISQRIFLLWATILQILPKTSGFLRIAGNAAGNHGNFLLKPVHTRELLSFFLPR